MTRPLVVLGAFYVVAAAVAVALLLSVAPDTYRTDLGNLPAWVAAIGTVGTLTAAVLVIDRERQDRRRAQAEKVGCWVSLSEPAGFELKISNTSDLPVHEAGVVLKSATSAGAYGFTTRTIPPQTNELTNEPTNDALNELAFWPWGATPLWWPAGRPALSPSPEVAWGAGVASAPRSHEVPTTLRASEGL
ncbi:hypothetical protein [Actinomycetospora flava]|uniref:Uncharacterized protein n=1 Tax=Actinomycetospora flava TaxID=3129232 RepID=A0ABU8M5E1_9PSEU